MSLPIINHPNSVLHHLAPDGGPFEKGYEEERLKRMRAIASPANRLLCHQIDVSFMEILPNLMIDAGHGLLRHGRVRDRLAKNPLLAVQMLLSSYDESFPLVEKTVLKSGEATVPLLIAIDEGRIKPSSSREKIEQSLLNEPWWGLYYLFNPTTDPAIHKERARFTSSLLQLTRENCNHDAQSALVFLALDQNSAPSKYLEVLKTDPMVAYLATRLFAHRDFDIKIDQIKNLNARWAAHIALWGAFSGGNVNDEIEAAICTSSAWTGEYIARSENRQKDWDWVKGLWQRAEAHSKQGGNGECELWADLLWAMLDRICLKIEGKPHQLTMKESYSRHSHNTPTTMVSSTPGA